MGLLNIHGCALFHERLGSGPPVIFVHGGPCMDHTSFRPWLDPLADDFELIFYDQRGHGRSAAAAHKTMTRAQLGDDLAALCERFGQDRATVVGHSFGGFIALECALRHPGLIRQLVLVSTAPSAQIFRQVRARAVRKGASERMLQHFGRRQHTDEAIRAAFLEIAPLYFDRPDPALIATAFASLICRADGALREGELGGYDLRTRIADIDIPTLILAGDNDFVCPDSEARWMQVMLPNARLHVFEHCGHFPYIEQQQDCLQVIRGWLLETVDSATPRPGGARLG